jgi:CarD family transcriptional regulator
MQAGRKGAQRAGRERDMYSVGDNVVYPHHGAGTVTKVERKEVLGRQRDYLTIQITHNHMTVMVPVENVERVGLRKVVKADVVEDVVGVLRGSATEMPERWSRRYKYNDEKLKTGDIFEVAEVIRNLTIRYAEKDIPTGEKQMLAKAKKILASEFVYARDLSEDEATAFLDDLLAGVHADAQTQALVPPAVRAAEAPAPLTVV